MSKKRPPVIELTEQGIDFEAYSSSERPDVSVGTLKNFLDNAPISKLKKAKWISENDSLQNLCSLALDSSTTSKRSALFRKNSNADDVLIEFWVSRVVRAAKEKLLNYGGLDFTREEINQRFMKDLAKLSSKVDSLQGIAETLAQKGIILVFEPGVPGILTDGVSFKLPNGLPVIGMTLRYSRLDNFWFTLLHELSHIALHYDQLDEPIIDNLDNLGESDVEKQASLYAKFAVVDRVKWRTCRARIDRTDDQVIAYAREEGVHPALIAGLLQYELNNFRIFRKIVDAVDVNDWIRR